MSLTALDQLINECQEREFTFEQKNMSNYRISYGTFFVEWSLGVPVKRATVSLSFSPNRGWEKEAVGLWSEYIKAHCKEHGLNGMWIEDDRELSQYVLPEIIGLEEDVVSCFFSRRWSYLPVNEKGREQATFGFSTIDLMKEVTQTIRQEREYVYSHMPEFEANGIKEDPVIWYHMHIRGVLQRVGFFANQKKLVLGNSKTNLVPFETKEEAKAIIMEWIRDAKERQRMRELLSLPRKHFDKRAAYNGFSTQKETIYAHLASRYHFAEIEWYSSIMSHSPGITREDGTTYLLYTLLDTYLLIEKEGKHLLYIGETYEEMKRVAEEKGLDGQKIDEGLEEIHEIFEREKTL